MISDVFKLIDITPLPDSNLNWCFVTKDKVPLRSDGALARPNVMIDFCSYDKLPRYAYPEKAAGLGISVQASDICAIDVDKCFSIPFDISTADSRAVDIMRMFSFAYEEFSFSGTGLRVLFRTPSVEQYSDFYYIKNEQNKIEFYQPTRSYRYVTVTGRTIKNNPITFDINAYDTLIEFLEKYMRKPVKKVIRTIDVYEDTRSIEELLMRVKYHYYKNLRFQDLWFSVAPGSGADESERDFKIINYLFENITPDKDKLQTLFESSPYFKSKDWKHRKKWEYNGNRYYNYIYEQIRRIH